MDAPPNYEQQKGGEWACRIQKGLYGLKQSGFTWSECFKDFLTNEPKYRLGFKPMSGEPNLYRKVFTDDSNNIIDEIFLAQYVDDCFIAASSDKVLEWFLEKLSERFPVNQKSSGEVSMAEPGRLLSMQLYYDKIKGILTFNQSVAITTLAEKFGVIKDISKRKLLPIHSELKLPKYSDPQDNIKPNDYLSIVGSCLHISQVSRPDCAYAVGVLCRHGATPGKAHWDAAIDLVSYLYATRNWSIQYKRSQPNSDPTNFYQHSEFAGVSRTIDERLKTSKPDDVPNNPDYYADADLAGDRETRKSTSGFIIMMNGGPICWGSKLQKLCAQSSAESEIYAVTDSVKEALHIKLLCEECGIRLSSRPMNIWEDNQACIHMGHNLRGSNNAKHFELRLRFLNEHVREKNIEFSHIGTKDQLADAFTKPLAFPLFSRFRDRIMVNINSLPSNTSGENGELPLK
jgi:hypothetical protein